MFNEDRFPFLFKLSKFTFSKKIFILTYFRLLPNEKEKFNREFIEVKSNELIDFFVYFYLSGVIENNFYTFINFAKEAISEYNKFNLGD